MTDFEPGELVEMSASLALGEDLSSITEVFVTSKAGKHLQVSVWQSLEEVPAERYTLPGETIVVSIASTPGTWTDESKVRSLPFRVIVDGETIYHKEH